MKDIRQSIRSEVYKIIKESFDQEIDSDHNNLTLLEKYKLEQIEKEASGVDFSEDVIEEMGQDDPIQNAQSMVSSNEEQLSNLEKELKYRESDARVSGMPGSESNARKDRVELTKDKVDNTRKELELAKQAELNALSLKQMQDKEISVQSGQSQIQPQI